MRRLASWSAALMVLALSGPALAGDVLDHWADRLDEPVRDVLMIKNKSSELVRIEVLQLTNCRGIIPKLCLENGSVTLEEDFTLLPDDIRQFVIEPSRPDGTVQPYYRYRFRWSSAALDVEQQVAEGTAPPPRLVTVAPAGESGGMGGGTAPMPLAPIPPRPSGEGGMAAPVPLIPVPMKPSSPPPAPFPFTPPPPPIPEPSVQAPPPSAPVVSMGSMAPTTCTAVAGKRYTECLAWCRQFSTDQDACRQRCIENRGSDEAACGSSQPAGMAAPAQPPRSVIQAAPPAPGPTEKPVSLPPAGKPIPLR
ncbi:MAG: hypothetical protein K2Q10_10940 [Rhodospirillales bacterium]|nr:hypothetical protein [Rhodospirillales bacterium]